MTQLPRYWQKNGAYGWYYDDPVSQVHLGLFDKQVRVCKGRGVWLKTFATEDMAKTFAAGLSEHIRRTKNDTIQEAQRYYESVRSSL